MCNVCVSYDGDKQGWIWIETPHQEYSRLVPCEVGDYDPSFVGMYDELDGILQEWGIPYRTKRGSGVYGPNTWRATLEKCPKMPNIQKVTISVDGSDSWAIKIGRNPTSVHEISIPPDKRGDARRVCETLLPDRVVYSPEKVGWCENMWYCWI